MFFNNFYINKRILITGITGFKGSWLAETLKFLGADVYGFGLSPKNDFDHFNYLSYQEQTKIGDIRDQEVLSEWVNEIRPEIVFHLAAQPLVRESYVDPVYTYHTNVIGTLHLYEACLKVESVKCVISITTDKVYENKEWNWAYRENDRLGGHDPYSSSKACVELLTASYRNSFLKDNFDLATTRAGNVIGGGDWSQDRIVPDIVRAIQKGESLVIRRPSAVRPFQHVLEPLGGYLLLAKKIIEGVSCGTSLNFGPDQGLTTTVLDIVDSFNSNWPEFNYVVDEDSSLIHEAGLLKLDISEAESNIGWRPILDFGDTMSMTIEWYKSFIHEKKIITSSQVESFFIKAALANIYS